MIYHPYRQPEDDIEREACRFPQPACGVVGLDGWDCTRGTHTDGDHVSAFGGMLENLVAARWSDDASRVSKPEHILCAAIYVDTGEAHPRRMSYNYPKTGLVFTGWRHADCSVTLNAWAERLTKEERERIGEDWLRGRCQGFLTSIGRFVDRAEAMIIAREAGQTTSKKSGLFSEDLY